MALRSFTKGWLVFLGVVLIVLVISTQVSGNPLYWFAVASGWIQPFTRPPGVPRAAIFVSLVEDGMWFQYAVDTQRNVDIIKAWDSNGQVLADGECQLEELNRAADRNELHPSMVQFDYRQNKTDYIYLFQEHHWWGDKGLFGKILIPVKKTSSGRSKLRASNRTEGVLASRSDHL